MTDSSPRSSRRARTRPWRALGAAALLAMTTTACAVFDAFGGDQGDPIDGEPDGGDIPPIACPPLPGLAVHLPFDEGMGTVAADLSPNGNDGRLTNMNDDDWVDGRLGFALDFDGVDDFVTSGQGQQIANLPAMSMCAWIQPRSFPNKFPTIADKSQDSFTGGWNFYIEDGGDGLLGFLTNRRQFATGEGIQLGRTQHVCAVWDGTDGTGGIDLYIDGENIAITATGDNGMGNDSDAGRELRIGRVNDGSLGFDGVIDDYQLYSRPLSPAEIEVLLLCAGP